MLNLITQDKIKKTFNLKKLSLPKFFKQIFKTKINLFQNNIKLITMKIKTNTNKIRNMNGKKLLKNIVKISRNLNCKIKK